MPITGTGWELLVQRLGIQKSRSDARTYGAYQAFLNGQPITALKGNVCECPGPGENDTPGSQENKKRIKAGRYPLWTQFGPLYWTMGYTPIVNPQDKLTCRAYCSMKMRLLFVRTFSSIRVIHPRFIFRALAV
jgi:hypothetical protein